MRTLILGCTGMLGHHLFRALPALGHETFGTVRGGSPPRHLAPADAARISTGIEASDLTAIMRAIVAIRPAALINCIGVIKQLPSAKDPIPSLTINALLPHMLSNMCVACGIRFIHISTDCVFRGDRGSYREEDITDAEDLYGRSKALGEVSAPHALTIRTSIIGHELGSRHGLLEWFLSQQAGPVRGWSRAIYSGFPTTELASIIGQHILTRTDLHGVVQVSSDPINKFDLLHLIRASYGTTTQIMRDEGVAIDRSLDSSRFRSLTGYRPPSWDALIAAMRADHAVNSPKHHTPTP